VLHVRKFHPRFLKKANEHDLVPASLEEETADINGSEGMVRQTALGTNIGSKTCIDCAAPSRSSDYFHCCKERQAPVRHCQTSCIRKREKVSKTLLGKIDSNQEIRTDTSSCSSAYSALEKPKRSHLSSTLRSKKSRQSQAPMIPLQLLSTKQ
jgi:hypothetical protein